MAVQGEKTVELNARSVLQRTTEYDIYRYYLGSDFTLGRAFLSPFRKEVNPSFSININKRGRLKHMDYTDLELSGGCFDFVQQLFGIGYNEALRRIDFDLQLGICYSVDSPGSTVGERRQILSGMRADKFFQVYTRKFTRDDLSYWSLYGITEEELIANEVYSVKRLLIDKKVYPLSNDSPTFGYWYDGKWKIYRPLAEDKWLSNVSGSHMSGLGKIKQGCDTVIVTKSKKDEIVLSKFLPYVCSVQQENTIAINSANISLLNSTCNRVLLNFDSDKVGVQACKYYNQFGFGWVNCPKGYTDPSGRMVKDFSDLARYYGLEEVIKHFKTKGII